MFTGFKVEELPHDTHSEMRSSARRQAMPLQWAHKEVEHDIADLATLISGICLEHCTILRNCAV